MSTPNSWRAIEIVAAALTDIRIAHGYRTDAGLRILTEAFQLGQADPFPTLRIFEDDFEEEDSTVDVITLKVEGYIQHAIDGAQRKAHDLREDALEALRKVRKPRSLPAPLVGFTVVSPRIFQRPEGYPYAVCQVGLRARLVTQSSAT